MSLRLRYNPKPGQFAEAMRGLSKPIAQASTEALRTAADKVKTDARQSISAAGFSKRWENALRVDVYPKNGNSMNAAAVIHHKIPYADVFESGATVRGKPKLWIPLSTTPKKVNRKTMTPENFTAAIGPLFPIKAKNGVEVLAAKMTVGKATLKAGPPYKVRPQMLRKGAAGQGITVAVPLFTGVDTIRIPKKFNITEIVQKARDDLPNLYLKSLNPNRFE